MREQIVAILQQKLQRYLRVGHYNVDFAVGILLTQIIAKYK